jgi:hypothetical protein
MDSPILIGKNLLTTNNIRFSKTANCVASFFKKILAKLKN